MKNAIAVDYDGTISLNPKAFKELMPKLADALGLGVIVATSRSGTTKDQLEFIESEVPLWAEVVWCGSEWKVDVCRKAGYNVIFWIDDEPEGDKRGGILWARLMGAWKWIKKYLEVK